jgi:hypothetical protein
MSTFRHWKTIGTIGLTLVMALPPIGGVPLPALGSELRPFRGHVEEVIIDVTPAPEGLLVTATGEGQATHLGRFTRLSNVVVHPEDGSAEGTIVFTAANGDQLFMDVIGLPTTTASISGTYTFTGGTGRFSNATGGADFAGVIAPDGIHIIVAFGGTIQY